MLENAEEFVGHFRFRPHEGLQALHPFEVGNNHAAGVAKNIGNDERLRPSACSGSGPLPALVGPLAPSARMRHLILSAFFSVDHAIDRARREDIAWHLQQLVRIDPVALIEGAQVALFLHV